MNVQKCLCADGGDSCLSPRVFENDLIGYFSFDQHLVADESGNLKVKPKVISGPGYGNLSIKKGLTSASMYSSASNAYTISGNVLKSMKEMTLSFWVYFIRRGEGWTSILRKGRDGHSTPSLSISSADGTLELVVATTNDARYSILSNGALQTGRWHHIGITVSRSAVVLYINGFQDSMRNFDSKVIVSSSHLSSTTIQ